MDEYSKSIQKIMDKKETVQISSLKMHNVITRFTVSIVTKSCYKIFQVKPTVQLCIARSRALLTANFHIYNLNFVNFSPPTPTVLPAEA